MLRRKPLTENESPEGTGVAKRTPKKLDINGQWEEPKKIGKAWPRKHNDTPAMCDVDEDGVEHEPQGVHISKHAKAEDGITSEVGHNWPNQPKNKGGTFEKMDGYSWKGGGELAGGGSEGGDEGTKNESWTPEQIASLIESDEINVQELFNNYARRHKNVCLEDFQTLCHAHGLNLDLTDRSMLHLMDKNPDFVFYENGNAYLGVPVSEDVPGPMGGNEFSSPGMGRSSLNSPGMGEPGMGGAGMPPRSNRMPQIGSGGRGAPSRGAPPRQTGPSQDMGMPGDDLGGLDDPMGDEFGGGEFDGGDMGGHLDGPAAGMARGSNPQDDLGYEEFGDEGMGDSPYDDEITDDDVLRSGGEFGRGDEDLPLDSFGDDDGMGEYGRDDLPRL